MILKKFLPSKPSKLRCLILVGIMICLYIIDNPIVASYIGSQTFVYYIKPLLWTGLSLLVLCFPKVKPRAKIKHKNLIIWWSFNFGVIFIMVSILGGLLDGFGRSPYSHSLLGAVRNIILVGSVLIATELIRSYLTNSFTKEENYLVFTAISLFLTILSIPLNRFNSLNSVEGTIKFVSQYFAPEFSKNLLATYLVFLGGAIPAIIYLGVVNAFHWLSPILPNLKWITTAFIGILCPSFFLIAIQNVYAKATKQIKRERDEESLLSWMITSVFSIAIVWFAVGVFPIYPSVIATGSMEPMISPGDVILVSKATGIEGIKLLKTGDVIQFRRDTILISHRILDIREEDGSISFKTKGDNNSIADADWVEAQQVRGKIIKVVPKVGWPTLLLKQNKDLPLDDIEF